MRDMGMTAYIIPASDPHISEYIAPRWKSREWISGFDGSAGTVVVTMTEAGLWTDSRYFLQAEQQLASTGIELFRIGVPETPDYTEWIISQINEGDVVGLDGAVFTVNDVRRISDILSQKKIVTETKYDLFESIWTDRPGLPTEEIFSLPVEYSGVSASEKISRVQDVLRATASDLLLIAALDEIAWLYNIRGNDVECNPVAVAYAVVRQNEAILFIDAEKVSDEMRMILSNEGIILADYQKITDYLQALPDRTVIMLDGNKVNYALCSSMIERCRLIERISPVTLMKCVKNETELSGIRNAMIKDGVALTRFFMWLERSVGVEPVTECDIAEKLYDFRDEQMLFVGESFSTIAGYAGHGAIVHYRAVPQSASEIKKESFLLIDSGGQYFDGTTDITRTIALGDVSAQMKKDYTLVLKGHIAIATCRFPEGTRGAQIDVLARKALWDEGLNYLHGTGHGVGHFLNVHEGPQSIRMDENPTKLQPGMVISNEPGLYRTNEYGIRLENLVVVQELVSGEYGRFYGFETLTLFPFDMKSIDVTLLDKKEIEWLNRYHASVFEKLSEKLTEEERGWLSEKTKMVEL